MKTIDLEHHFVAPLYMETLRTNKAGPKLADMGRSCTCSCA